MKRLIFIVLAMAMLIGFLTSCNRQICPAYADSNQEQVEENV